MIPRPPLNEATLRMQFTAITQEVAAHLRAAEHFREELALLKARAAEAGLAKLFRELEAPPAPVAARVEEPTVRVRVLESFSGQWAGLPYDAAAGDVIAIPQAYAARAVTLFERVPDSTPLHRQPVNWPR